MIGGERVVDVLEDLLQHLVSHFQLLTLMLGKEETIVQGPSGSHQLDELLIEREPRMVLPQSQQCKQGPGLFNSPILAYTQEHNSVKNTLNAFVQCVAV